MQPPTLFGTTTDLHRALTAATDLIKAWKLAYKLALAVALSVIALAAFREIDLLLGMRIALVSTMVNSLALLLAHVRINRLSK